MWLSFWYVRSIWLKNKTPYQFFTKCTYMDYFGQFSLIFWYFWLFLAWKRGYYHQNYYFWIENCVSVMQRCDLLSQSTWIIDFQKWPFHCMAIFGDLPCKPLYPKTVQKYQNEWKIIYYPLSEPDAPNISKDEPYRMKNGGQFCLTSFKCNAPFTP